MQNKAMTAKIAMQAMHNKAMLAGMQCSNAMKAMLAAMLCSHAKQSHACRNAMQQCGNNKAYCIAKHSNAGWYAMQ